MLSFVKDVLIRITLHEDKKGKVDLIYFKRNMILIFWNRYRCKQIFN